MNMRPELSTSDMANHRQRNVEIRRNSLENFAGGTASPNIANVVIRQFRAWIVLAFNLCVSSFFCTIRHVVELSAEKQVIGANALSVIAMVANILAIMDFTKRKNIAHAMGQFRLSAKHKPAISTPACASSPKPARLRFVDLGPESDCCSRVAARTLARTEWQFDFLSRIGFQMKRLATCAADQRLSRMCGHLESVVRGVMRPGVCASRPCLLYPIKLCF